MFAFWENVVDKKSIMNTCFKWIEECDAVVIVSVNKDKKESGTNKALEHAKTKNKKVFYSIEEIPDK